MEKEGFTAGKAEGLAKGEAKGIAIIIKNEFLWHDSNGDHHIDWIHS